MQTQHWGSSVLWELFVRQGSGWDFLVVPTPKLKIPTRDQSTFKWSIKLSTPFTTISTTIGTRNLLENLLSHTWIWKFPRLYFEEQQCIYPWYSEGSVSLNQWHNKQIIQSLRQCSLWDLAVWKLVAELLAIQKWLCCISTSLVAKRFEKSVSCVKK